MKSKFTKISIALITICCSSILFVSCSNYVFFPGRIEIVSRTFDYSLQDSAIIHGRLLEVLSEEPIPYSRATILVVEMGVTTQDCNSGYFSIKIPPGTYTLRVSDDRYLRKENAQYLKIANILPNEKVKVIFYRPTAVF